MTPESLTRKPEMNGDCRKAFEEWFGDGFPGETEIVEDEVTRGMWQSWQAAWNIRASVADQADYRAMYDSLLSEYHKLVTATKREIVDVELVKQRNDFDCGPCCLAMLTGRSLDDVIETIGKAYHPEFGLRHDWRALTSLGFPSGSFIREDLAKGASEWDKKRFLHMAWKRKAILTVPSLNHEGKWHMVYFDGKTLYDPSTKKRYEAFEQLEPVEIIIFAPTTSIEDGEK